MPITKATASSVAPAAKGDLVVGSATNDAAVLGVGSNNQVLTADSSTTTGVKWAAVAASPASASATVTTSEGTSSSSFTDLTTAGPAVTLTTGTKALVILSCYLEQTNGWEAYMGYAVSGSTTISATTAKCLQIRVFNNGNTNLQASIADMVTLTAGSNTFTAKYASAYSTATFAYREIIVIDLGS